MKIVQEMVDLDNYIEISLSQKEIAALKEYLIVTKSFYSNGTRNFLSITKGTYESTDDEDTEIWPLPDL